MAKKNVSKHPEFVRRVAESARKAMNRDKITKVAVNILGKYDVYAVDGKVIAIREKALDLDAFWNVATKHPSGLSAPLILVWMSIVSGISFAMLFAISGSSLFLFF